MNSVKDVAEFAADLRKTAIEKYKFEGTSPLEARVYILEYVLEALLSVLNKGVNDGK